MTKFIFLILTFIAFIYMKDLAYNWFILHKLNKYSDIFLLMLVILYLMMFLWKAFGISKLINRIIISRKSVRNGKGT